MSDTSETSDAADDDTIDAVEEVNDEYELDKHEFKNWIRGMKGLEYLQQGLASFVDREFAIKHTIFLQGLNVNLNTLTPCNCTLKNILPDHTGGPCCRQNPRECYCLRPSKKRRICPNGICSQMIDFIVQEHRYTSPSLKNSDMTEWSTNAWSIAKCYTSDSKCEMDSARSTDASGLLNIIINANFLQQKLTCIIGSQNDLISQAREYRNKLHHAAIQELTDQQLQLYLDHFISVLQDPKTLLNDSDAKSAVKKLNMLKNDQIHIAKEEIETIVDRIKKEKENALHAISTAEASLLKKMEKYDSDTNTVSEVIAKTNILESSLNQVANRLKQNEEDVEKLKENASAKDRTPAQNDDDEDQFEDDDKEDAIPEIPTDDDSRQDIEDKPIDLREYQKELAKKGMDGKNVIVLAPTNTGKTRVACKIIQHHFQSRAAMNDFAKVAFLVATEPLAFQQGEQCANLLPYYRTKVITGRVQRQTKHYLKDYVQRRDILVVTSQLLLNCLNLKEIDSLKEFSLIVIDECHHTTGYHIYNQVMSVYLDMKMRDNIGLPQIVGLTASLGVGGSTVEESVEKHMKDTMASLDTYFLSTARDTKDQLHEFANKAKEYKKVSPKRSNDRYRMAILDIMNAIDVYMANHDSLTMLHREEESIKENCRVPPDSVKGSEQFLQWISSFYDNIGKLQNDRAVRMLSPCCHHLEVYNRALMMHVDARTCDSLAVLEKFMETQKQTNETDEMLACLYRSLKEKNFENEPENPKLMKLETILMQHLRGDETRCIIFTRTTALAIAIKNCINDNESLRKLNARELLGRKKMSRLKQKDALEYFKNGRHKVIVATSVAEEGLDVTACNLVIRYEHVKNEIARLQSRGRARAKDSSYYILTEEGSNLIQKEEELEIREHVMEKVIQKLRDYTELNQQQWLMELNSIQRDKIATERRREENILANVTPGVKHIICFNCNAFLCLSTDIRKFQKIHRIVIADDVAKRFIFLRSEEPSYQEDDFKSDGEVLCVKCQHRFGGVFEFMRTEFPIIKIKRRIKVTDKILNKTKPFKNWKEVNFVVESISSQELERIVKVRDEYVY